MAERDLLIPDHVASDECNVSPRERSKKLLPARPASYMNKKKVGAKLASL